MTLFMNRRHGIVPGVARKTLLERNIDERAGQSVVGTVSVAVERMAGSIRKTGEGASTAGSETWRTNVRSFGWAATQSRPSASTSMLSTPLPISIRPFGDSLPLEGSRSKVRIDPVIVEAT